MNAIQITTASKQQQVDLVVEAVVSADGNIHLAAERLNITTTFIYDILANEDALDALKKQLQVRALFTMYNVTKNTAFILNSVLEQMEPFEMARTYLQAQQMLNDELRKAPAGPITNNTNNVQLAISTLPPDVQEALRALQQPTEITVIESLSSTDNANIESDG